MTKNERDQLREIIRANRQHYQRQLAGLEPAGWDHCVLTATTERQARGYELEIQRRQRAGWLPADTRYLVVPDLEGRRIGSGGAACYALRRVVEDWEQQKSAPFNSPRILLINSGGDSKRIPHCSTFGKAFAGLPFALFPGGPQSTAFDELMVSLSRLPGYLGGGAVILSVDVLIVFEPGQFATGSGVTGLGCLCPWELASRHGVYVCSPEGGKVQDFLQKPTHTQMQQAGALADERALLDTGLLAFDIVATRRLAELAGVRWEADSARFEPGVLEQPGAEQARIDLYQEICLTLAGRPPTDTARLPEDLRQVREQVLQAVRGLDFSVAVPQPGSFVHLGTTREWRDFCIGQKPEAYLYMPPGDEPDSQSVTGQAGIYAPGSVIGELRASGPAVVEYCHLPECEVGEGAVLSGVEQNQVVSLPAGMVLHQVALVPGFEGGGRCVVQIYAVADNPKAPLDGGEATFCGERLEQWLAERDLEPSALWPHVPGGERCLWNARLFVPGERATSLRWARWLLTPPESKESRQEWLAQARISFADSLEQADQEATHRQRARLSGLRLARQIMELLPGEECARPLFDTIGSEVEVADIVTGVLQYLERETNLFLRARAYQILADLIGDARLQRVLSMEADQSEEVLVGGLREIVYKLGGRELHTPFEVSSWLENLAFAQVSEAVGRGLGQYPTHRGKKLIAGTQVTVYAPARLDFGGGWSDTPPFSLERGGTVLNAAILLDGQRPIKVRGEVLPQPVIELLSVDGQAREVIVEATSLTQHEQPGAPLALHKAALILSGLAGPGPGADLREFLEEIGGGLRLETTISLPQGSGLGTSSLAAMALLRCLDMLQGKEASPQELSSRVLYLEQMLTTGGGWQDQLGGLVPGIKLLETEPGYAQEPRITPVQMALATAEELSQRLLVCFVGERRIAKNILRQIMRRYLARVPEVVGVLQEIKRIARAMKSALEQGDLDEFGRLMKQHWELNKLMDRRTSTAHVEELIRAVGDLAVGYKLAGAGGGGFMEIIAKDQEAAQEIRQRLQPRLAAKGGRFYEVGIDQTGVTGERKEAPDT